MVGKLMEKDKFNYFIKTEKNNWEVIIGLEVHACLLYTSDAADE